jgi:hypothetical protein
MTQEVVIAGVGMIPFVKPGTHEPYPKMAAAATARALADAGLDFGSVQQAYAGYVFGDSTAGQRAVYEVGMTGIPLLTSITIARPARQHCSSPDKLSPAVPPTVFWPSALNR